jgi:hypothetical protein
MLEAKRLAACGLRFYQIAMRDNDPQAAKARRILSVEVLCSSGLAS